MLRTKPAGGPRGQEGRGRRGLESGRGPGCVCAVGGPWGVSVGAPAVQAGLSSGVGGLWDACWAASLCLGLPGVENGYSSASVSALFPSKCVRGSGLGPVPLQPGAGRSLLTGPHCALTGLLGQRWARPGQSPGPRAGEAGWMAPGWRLGLTCRGHVLPCVAPTGSLLPASLQRGSCWGGRPCRLLTAGAQPRKAGKP